MEVHVGKASLSMLINGEILPGYSQECLCCFSETFYETSVILTSKGIVKQMSARLVLVDLPNLKQNL